MSRLLVIGTGLIGGSFALAMREAGCFTDIVGLDADVAVAERARTLGIIDVVASDANAAIGAADTIADAIVVAVPTLQIAQIVEQIRTRVGRGMTTVFDVGSVKGSVLNELRGGSGVPPWFVPSHPMAGSEQHGPDAATANLFRGRHVIVTPQAETDRAALNRVSQWWRAAGANVFETSADVHDEMVALTSHLPHLIAYAFMNWVDAPHSAPPHRFAGPGLQDFTRIAASEAAMWRRILVANRSAVLAQYDGWSSSVGEIVELLRAERFDELEQLLANAQAARARLTDELTDELTERH